MNTLNLVLEKRSSTLDGLNLIEVIPNNRIKALLKSDVLLLTWGDLDDDGGDIHKKQIIENYKNEKDQLASYYKYYNKTIGGVSVKYGKPKHKWGRSFPYKSLGLSSFRRKVRNTLIDGLYYDFDLNNCQPQVIKNLCETNNIPCPKIQRYCAERTEILQQVQDHYEVDKKKAKDLFIRMCFFGTFYGWCKTNKITKPPLEFIIDFERELNDIAERIRKVNKELYDTARKRKEETGDNKEKRILGSFFGLYNQEYESRIVEAVLCYLINQTDLLKLDGTTIPVGAYEYDGIKLLKKNVDAFEGGLDAVLQLLNDKTFELTGFRLEWNNKPFEEVFDLKEWIEKVEEDEKPNAQLIEDCAVINKALNNADCGIIETIIELKPNHFIFSVDKTDGSKGEWYGWNGNRWEKSDAPLRKSIMYDIETYWKGIMEKWNEKYEDMVCEEAETDCNYMLWKKTKKDMDNRIWGLKTAGGIQSCVSIAKTLMANYTLEFDTKEDLFGCENGVLDFAEECFRPYRFDDFITFTCGYNFTPYLIGFKVQTGIEEVLVEGKKQLKPIYHIVSQDDLTEDFNTSFSFILETYKKIFPDEELRNYFFKVISTGLSGRAIEKFFVYNGAGRNGKGLTNEFLAKVFGSYFESVSPTIFSENQKNKSSSNANPEIAKINKKRYVVAKEPQKDAPLHNNIIKDFTGGGTLSARMLYSSITSVLLCLTLVMECNVKPPFSEAPQDADIERINDILFVSKFCSNKDEIDEENNVYEADAGLKPILMNSITHRNTMLNILIHNLLLVKAQNYNVDYFKPESVKQRSLAYLQNSYDIHNIFKELFELRCEENAKNYLNWKGEVVDEDWSLAKIAQVIRKSKDFYELPKSKQKDYKAETIVEFFNKNKIYRALVYVDTHTKMVKIKNWRLKVVEEELDE